MSTLQGGWRGPNIVKRGLVLRFEASSPNSYSNNFLPSWKDISGNGTNGTLMNSPVFYGDTGSLLFNGSSNYVNSVGSLSTFSFLQNTGVYTISTWVRPLNISKEMYIAGNSNASNVKGFFFGTGNGNNITFYLLNGLSPSPLNHIVSNCFLNTTDWVNIVAVGDGVKNQFWRNGVAFGSSLNFTLPFSSGDSGRVLILGNIAPASFPWWWDGYISNFLIYDKNLSGEEILQNYNVMKSRFGL